MQLSTLKKHDMGSSKWVKSYFIVELGATHCFTLSLPILHSEDPLLNVPCQTRTWHKTNLSVGWSLQIRTTDNVGA